MRDAVVKFIRESKYPGIHSLKIHYTENIAPAMGESWEEYWRRMAQDRTWADHMFIQATAWLIQCDMLIVETSCTQENPYIHISGNIENATIACKELMYLGSKSNSHYQSIVEIEEAVIEPLGNEQTTENVDQDLPPRPNERKFKDVESREQLCVPENINTTNSTENPTWVRGNKTCPTEGGNKASSPKE